MTWHDMDDDSLSFISYQYNNKQKEWTYMFLKGMENLCCL